MATQNRLLNDRSLADAELLPPRRMTEEEFVAWADEDTRANGSMEKSFSCRRRIWNTAA